MLTKSYLGTLATSPMVAMVGGFIIISLTAFFTSATLTFSISWMNSLIGFLCP